MTRSQETNSSKPQSRQRWIGLLAKAELAELESTWENLPHKPSFEFLRQAETGLVMIQGRAGGSGHAFNMGEMTVTRCSIKLNDGFIGHGYVSGRDKRHAEFAALFDALMQNESISEQLEQGLLTEIESRILLHKRDVATKTASTKVDFFTLTRGEDNC